MCANADDTFDPLVDGHQGLLVKIAILLNLAEEHITSEALNSKVELVAPHIASYSLHRVVGPVLELCAVNRIVVLNSIKSLLEDLSI